MTSTLDMDRSGSPSRGYPVLRDTEIVESTGGHTQNKKRKALGLFVLGCVVFLWIASSFLQSSVFADKTYSKPFFITYINTSFFATQLIPFYLRRFINSRSQKSAYYGRSSVDSSARLLQSDRDASRSRSASPDPAHVSSPSRRDSFKDASRPSLRDQSDRALTVRETFRLSAKFCALWFFANWMNSASFEYTSVASSTILVSTSSVFTLILGAVTGVEKFSLKKCLGVLGSLSGVVLISLIDTSKEGSNDDLGSFPYKSPGEIAIGDGMALLSALVYGVYATILTKHIGDESKVDMQLFFGFIGVVAFICMWPGIGLLHLFGLESFSLPPDGKVWGVVLLNAVVSLGSDMCWAYAVLLTSPLIVTVGLTMTIPLSLIGQMIINAQYTGPLYWLGAVIVILSFIFISYEGKEDNDRNGS